MISNFLTHEVRRKKQPPKNDPQRVRLYKLEREFIGVSVNHVVSKSNLQDIADHACRYYRLPKIKIVVVDQPREPVLGWCESYSIDDGPPFDFVIHQNRGYHGASVCVLLHELAHYITDSYWKKHETHGPQFVAIYSHLLNKYRIMPAICFRALAKKRHVKIGRYCKPDQLRG